MSDGAIYLSLIGAVLGMFISGGVGAAIGRQRGQAANGFALGAFLGPIGWIIAALLPEAGRKCPECLGVVPPGAKRCKHCASELNPPRSPAPVSNYYLLRGEQTEGPFSKDQLKIMISSGALKLETLCAVEGGSTWLPLGQIM